MEGDTDTLGVDESFAVYGSDGEEIKFDFSSHVKDTEPSDEDAEAPCLKPHESALIPFTHSYLGELRDVSRGRPPLIFSQKDYRLPIIHYNCVTFPGQIVPVRLRHEFADRMRLVVNEESELAGYVVVVWCPHPLTLIFGEGYHGCIARVLQISEDGQKALVQGVCVCTFPDWGDDDDVFLIMSELSPLDEVQVLARPETCPPPGEARSHLACLANSAMADFRRNYPLVGGFGGDPVQIAYWLAANTPLPTSRCQFLLRKPPLELLRAVREIPAEVLKCGFCGTEVADSKDLIQVVDQGPCLVCVKPEGFTPEIICLCKEPIGTQHLWSPSSESPWFPGYAWQKIGCACLQLDMGAMQGWVFTALEANMPIQKFWGLTKESIRLKDNL